MTSMHTMECFGIEDALEPLMDKYGLANVITALADICNEKAEHLRGNWQDDALARVWERDARRLHQCASKLELSR